jgi:hypothetical protein
MVITFGKYIFSYNKMLNVFILIIYYDNILGANRFDEPFGQFNYRLNGESDVLLLDISNDSEYIWTTSFDPYSSLSPSPSTSTSTYTPSISSKNNGITIGVVIGIILSILLLISTFLFMKKRRKIIDESMMTNEIEKWDD